MKIRKSENGPPSESVRAGSPVPWASPGVSGGARAWRGAGAPSILTVVLFSLAQQVWFKNRRAKWRRDKRSSSEESENAEVEQDVVRGVAREEGRGR